MKKGLLHIILMMAGMKLMADPFTILFPDGTQLSIHKVEVVNDSYGSWKENANPLKSLFYIYFTPADIAQYKSIFYQNGYPEDIETVYGDWRKKMEGVSFTPQAIFWGTLDNVEISCIQYYVKKDQLTIQVSFLARRIEGKWYPMGGALNMKYQHVMGLMATLQPELVANLLQPDPASPFMKTAESLRMHCMAGSTTLTEACLYQSGESWGMSESADEKQNEMNLFRDRMNQEMPEVQQRTIDSNLHQYVSTLGLPEEGVKRVMYYFSKKESMKAIAVMRSYGLSLDNATLFQKLNEVQQTTQYKSIEFKPQSASKPD